jgi:hypothetical protein
VDADRLHAPTHSLDPADWWIYSDLLQDHGAPAEEAARARRVGNSLKHGKSLVLAFLCPEENLAGHWLRIGRTWFIPVAGTYVRYITDFRWFRSAWVRGGFERYPCENPADRRDEGKMIRYASGTPFRHRYKDFKALRKRFEEQVTLRFFETHGLSAQPAEWL